MISKDKHSAHGSITKPNQGDFGRNELALYGTTCEHVKKIVLQIQEALPSFDIAYVDADHENSSLRSTAFQEKENSFTIGLPESSTAFTRRMSLSQTDGILINGNHFSGKAQIIVCDESKEQSLRKRATQLDNVLAIVTMNNQQAVPDYVKELVSSAQNIPVFSLENIATLTKWYEQEILQTPALRVLILAGGKSSRMGIDKTMISHHDKPQTLHLAAIADTMKLPVHISCRPDQQEQFQSLGLQTIADRISDIGPIGGIISAFMHFPDNALLVLASDIPLIDEKVISTLIENRSPAKNATAYQSVTDGFPEPLIAIWEPKSYLRILSFLGQGYSCPRKVLINNNVQIIIHNEAKKLTNVNTPEDLAQLHDLLKNSKF